MPYGVNMEAIWLYNMAAIFTEYGRYMV